MTQTDGLSDDHSDALPVGSTIGGYTLRRVLGQGGFGITYEAQNRVTDRTVAIKEFFPSAVAKRDGTKLVYLKANAEHVSWALRKFEETTRVLCKLSHPNIVQAIDYIPINNTGYMIMEHLHGGTLRDWLRSRDRKPRLYELRPLLEPVMDALTYVHGKGLVHRDIAPDNILITSNGRPVLIDFGSVSADLSLIGREQARSTVGINKRHYTAPEQMKSKTRPGVAGDIYSMGAVLYWSLCGEEPADGQDRMHAKIMNEEADPYLPLARRMTSGGGISAPMEALLLIDKCLEMRPESRPTTVAGMREGLWGYLDRMEVDEGTTTKTLRFDIAARSTRGGRSYQEDTWTLRALDGRNLGEAALSPGGATARDGALVIVADGMGGEGGGAEASQIIAERFNDTFFAKRALPPLERLRIALDNANSELLAAKQRRPALKEKSGSTLIAGIVEGNELHFLSVGDSLIFRFRDEEAHRINVLHERAPELDVRAAEIDSPEAWDHVLNDPQRNSITAAVMGFAIEPQHRQIAFRAIQPGDVLVFASDGIETLTLEHLRRAVMAILAKGNAAALAKALVTMTERLGARDQDNTTVVVVRALAHSDRSQVPPLRPLGRAPTPKIPEPRPGAAPRQNASPIAAAPPRPALRAAQRTLPFGTIGAAAFAVSVALVAIAYLLVWPRPHSQDISGGASLRASTRNAGFATQTGPVPSK